MIYQVAGVVKSKSYGTTTDEYAPQGDVRPDRSVDLMTKCRSRLSGRSAGERQHPQPTPLCAVVHRVWRSSEGYGGTREQACGVRVCGGARLLQVRHFGLSGRLGAMPLCRITDI